jgi:hypothetical protein
MAAVTLGDSTLGYLFGYNNEASGRWRGTVAARAAIESAGRYAGETLNAFSFALGRESLAGVENRWRVTRVAEATFQFVCRTTGAVRMVSLLAWPVPIIRALRKISPREPGFLRAIAMANLPVQTSFVWRFFTNVGFLGMFFDRNPAVPAWNRAPVAEWAMAGKAALTLASFGIDPVHRRLSTLVALGTNLSGLIFSGFSLRDVEVPRYKKIQAGQTGMHPLEGDRAHNLMKMAWHVAGVVLALLSTIMMGGYLTSLAMTRYLLTGVGISMAVIPDIYEIYLRQPLQTTRASESLQT